MGTPWLGRDARPRSSGGETPPPVKADTIELLETLMEDMIEQSYVRGAEEGVSVLLDIVKANGGPSPTNGLSKRTRRRSVRKQIPPLGNFRAFEAPG
ncbi:MAG: hypothetical protein F4X05_11590 [Rhodothermaceae bacterium]|nr:hypothetical protein [Rhodothermaceae bacterium]